MPVKKHLWMLLLALPLLGSASSPKKYVPHEVLVVYKQEVPAAEKGTSEYKILKRFPAFSRITKHPLRLVRSLLSTEELIEKFSKDPNVLHVEPNYVKRLYDRPDDNHFHYQWALENTGQSVNGQSGTPGADIDAVKAWDLTHGDSDVVVAVVDTGIDYRHEDLRDNIWVNQAELNGQPGVDDDNNGYVDDIYGYDFAGDNDGNNDSDPMDEDGHGTHVAGIIGAVGDNGVGISGVNWDVSLMALKVETPDETISNADIFEAFDYLLTMKGDPYRVNIVAVNASYGGADYSQLEKDYIDTLKDAGILLIAAAGNAGKSIDASPEYPASYDCENIIAVAATDQDDNLADWSNYGADEVDLAAPGENILSTYLNDDYRLADGTSMATPFVTGAVALVRSEHPNDTYAQTRARILENVDRLSSLENRVASEGRLNLYKALSNPLGNLPPVARNDNVRTEPDTPITINVLANDSDGDGDPLSIEAVGAPSHGSVTIDRTDQSLLYTPNEGFTGTDTFSYTVSDGNGGTDRATVAVTVGSPASSNGGGGGGGPSSLIILLGLLSMLLSGFGVLKKER